MIKENQKHFNRLQVLIDAFVLVFSYVMAWVSKFQILKNDDGKLPFKVYMLAMVAIVAVYLVLYHMFNLYTPKRVQGRRLELWNIVKANAVGMALILGVLYLIKLIDFSRWMLFYFASA